jgi:chromosome segregation ATPase
VSADTEALLATVRSALDYGSDFPGHEALESLARQMDALNAENARLNAENRDLLEKWSARGGRIDALAAELERVKAKWAELEREYQNLWDESERVKAERDGLIAQAHRNGASRRRQEKEYEARLDKALAALREIVSISGAGGSGEIPAMPIASRARAAIAEIEGEA